MLSRSFLLAVLALVLLGLGACGGGEETSPPEQPGQTASAGAVPFDRLFIDAMVQHHESAIKMAEEAQNAGLQEPELRTIAGNIVVTQQQEIDQMLAWREEWFASREVDANAGEDLGMSPDAMGMTHAAGDFAASEDVDGAFASAMIAHHEGAIAMAAMALERGQHPEIHELAQKIIDAQQQEIDRMKPHAGAAMPGMEH